MIVHISSVHNSNDTRIQRHLSMCRQSRLIGIGSSISEQFMPLFETRSKINRALFLIKILFYLPKSTSTIIFHDPELLLSMLILKKTHPKVRVFFDAHEDVLSDILQKTWLSLPVRVLALKIFTILFRLILPKIDGIITVNERLEAIYSRYNKNIYIIKNYPLHREIVGYGARHITKFFDELKLYYVGSISFNRGLKEILECAGRVKNKILLIGDFTDARTLEYAKNHNNWHNINYVGRQSGDEARILSKDFDAGLLMLDDIPTFFDGLPVKIFQYAALNQFIFWTGREGCYYEEYLSKYFSSYKLGVNLADVHFPSEKEFDIKIDNDLNHFSWEFSAKEFYNCVA